MKAPLPRIAVTGVGMVSALGATADSTFARILAGDRGFSPVSLFPVGDQRTRFAAEVRGLSVADVAPRGQADAWSRSDALAVIAAREALSLARLRPGKVPISVVSGGSTGGMYEAESLLVSLGNGVPSEASHRRLLSYPLSTTVERLTRMIGPVERGITVCSACSSGAVALVQAASWLRNGKARHVLAGGTDGLCQLTFTGFNALGATDVDYCRPFDVDRAGLSLGEGAAYLVLENEDVARARGARILAFFSGFAVAAEAHHITHPEPSGEPAARLIGEALRRAALEAADIDYVNAHGTGTRHNDVMEARALEQALGPETSRIFVSSSKGQVGHTLAASGALEAVLTVMALDAGALPPTGGLVKPDPELALRHVLEVGRREKLRAALSSSFGFGGTGCVLAFEHTGSRARKVPEHRRLPIAVSGAASIGPLGLRGGEANAEYAESLEAAEVVTVQDPLALLEPARSRRFDRSTALVTAGALFALLDAGLNAAGVGLIAGAAYGNVQRSVDFLKRVMRLGAKMASPAEFPHLVPSAPSGNASIYLGLTGPVLSVSDLHTSAEAAAVMGLGLLELGLAEAVVVGSAEAADALVARVIAPLHGQNRPIERREGSAWLVLEPCEHITARGARPLAVLADYDVFSSEARIVLPAPIDLLHAVVVFAGGGAGVLSFVEESAWKNSRRYDVVERAGCHEAAGSFALAAAAGLVGSGRVEEALVLGFGRGKNYVIHFVSAALWERHAAG